MSYPPPPGLPSSTPQPHVSLPARPPPSAVSPAATFKAPNGGSKPAFTPFAPRTIANANASTFRANGPAHYAAAPVTSYSSGPSYAPPPQQEVYLAQPPAPYADPSYSAATPQIRNPFVPTSGTPSTSNPYQAEYDPELEAQIQQWQSAYTAKDSDTTKTPYGVSMRRDGPTNANTVPLGTSSRLETSSPAISNQHASSAGADGAGKIVTVQREGGGTKWSDPSLLEWDPAHFRIFVGNLAGEVTDESLLKAFAKYPSVQKARVIRDKRTTKSKGYGFVSFSDGDDYFLAAREMQGKYIGSHPVLLKRSTTEVKASVVQPKGGKGKHGRHNGAGGGKKVEHGGVQKVPKTKGGLKVLG